jgi:Helicase HerA, central domain
MKPVLNLGAWRHFTGAEGWRALLLPAEHLVTHRVVVGMTGSGKTGLVTVMIEEAARARVPTVVVDEGRPHCFEKNGRCPASPTIARAGGLRRPWSIRSRRLIAVRAHALAYDSGNRPMVVSTTREGCFDSATMARTRS